MAEEDVGLVSKPPANLEVCYQGHVELFKHYSNQIFKARISTVSMVLICFAALLGIGKLSPAAGTPSSIEFTRFWIALLAGLAIPIFLLNEIAYVRRLFQVIEAGRKIEKEMNRSFYFSLYDLRSIWSVGMISLLSVAAFTAVAITKISAVESTIWPWIYLFITLIPITALSVVMWRFQNHVVKPFQRVLAET